MQAGDVARYFRRRTLRALAFGAALLLQGCRLPWSPEEGARAISLSGTIDAHEAELSFQTGGRILRLLTDEGRSVDAGQVVAELDPTDTELALERARSQAQSAAKVLAALRAGARPEEIRAAEAALAQVQADRRFADLDVERTAELIRQHFISAEAMDRARSTADAAAAKVDQARANLALLRAGSRKEDIDRGEADLAAARAAQHAAEQQARYVHLPSPARGVISARLAEAGQVVAIGRPVFKLAELDRPWVRAYLADADLPRVRLGQAAEVRVDGLPDKAFAGHLSFISAVAEFTPKTVETKALRVDMVYRITIDVDDPQHLLKIGMPADVRFALGP